MDLFRCLLILISILANFASTEPLHSEEHHEDAFHSVLKAMNFTNDTLRAEDVTSILTKLGVNNCSNAAQHRHKCVTAESLFMIFNISTSSIGEEDFSKFAPIIVYALLPKEEEHHAHGDDDHDDDDHDDDDHDDDEIVDVYNELLERYETTGLCEQIFDQLLKDVNKTTGELLGGDTCFSSQDILSLLNVSSDTETGKSLLPEISVIILSKLLQKQCIEIRYQSPLPCSSYFANHLFDEYAENDVISEVKIEELLKKLKIGKHGDDHDEKESVDNDEHGHRRRRSLSVHEGPLGSQIFGKPLGLQKRNRRETDEHGHGHGNETEKYQKCYSVDELFAIYKVNKKTGFKLEKFQRLSSALLHQIESEVCGVAHEDHSDSGVSEAQKWGYGILAVAIISMCSVLGVAIIPFMKTIFYQKAVVFLISLAVGTLVGDALLHLFPHAVGFHSGDGHDHGSGSSDESEDRDYLWKFLLASAAIYAFFLFETLTHLFLRKPIGHSHSVEHTRRHNQFAEHEHNVTEEIAVESSPQNKNTPVVLMNMAYVNDEEFESQKTDKYTRNGKDKAAVMGENLSDGNLSIKEKKEVKKTISSVAWNIIIGDTIHNVADGIAIGVAFSDSISGGISTSIAVFCHELPHELGDFAVLLSAGMSVKKALLANFLSACSCFIGLVFGILISEIQDVNLWIFALTAGFFIYIALTNMLPELMHSAEFNKMSKITMFSLQNLGILTGFTIMFLLSYYEEDFDI